jgi:uncharacterized membrane protein YphA (DoxX/SURF4 family)
LGFNFRRRKISSAGLPFTSTKAGRVTLHLLRLLAGSVFVFSGFVKAVDPLGTVYKISDYLDAFGGIGPQLTVLAYPAAFLLIVFELMVGVQLLLMLRFRISTLLALGFMVLMTALTLYIAIYNPVTDCGCFGDALKISNWQTFSKNIVLLIITLLLVVWRNKFKSFFLKPVEYCIGGVFLVAVIAFMMYNLLHLPVLDFRPYKIGVNIPEAMAIPEGAPADEYNYSFVYQKEGVMQTFTLDALPDSTWTFVEQKSELVRKGYEAPITSFTILNAAYQDVGHELLEHRGRTYLVVMYDITKTPARGIKKIVESLNARTDGRVMGVTASGAAGIEVFKSTYTVNFPVYTADAVFLKTMIRANPGVVVIENGTITDKRNWRDCDKIR